MLIQKNVYGYYNWCCGHKIKNSRKIVISISCSDLEV